jgi:hypothetical protein
MIDKIGINDLLVIFTYINMALVNFEIEQKSQSLLKINPNLLKIFLRHYPKYAESKNYELFSDEEDYKEIEGKINDN